MHEVAVKLNTGDGEHALELFAEPEPDDELVVCGLCLGAGTVESVGTRDWRRSSEDATSGFVASMDRVAERMTADAASGRGLSPAGPG
jgi:hypothetical protein